MPDASPSTESQCVCVYIYVYKVGSPLQVKYLLQVNNKDTNTTSLMSF